MKPSRRPVKGQKLDVTPRIPAFKFSTRNKTDAAYADRLATLKTKFGVPFTFRANAKLTPQRKGAITRQVRKLAEFLNPKNRFQFVPVPPKTLAKTKRGGTVARVQTTAKGVFVPLPKTAGSRRKTSVKVDKRTGAISTKTGAFTSSIKLFRTADVVLDPEMIIREAKRRGAETVFVTIKGHRGVSEKYGYSLKAFMQYMKRNVLPDLEDLMEEDEENRKGAFKNYFGIEFVSHEWKRPGSANKNKVGRKGSSQNANVKRNKGKSNA